MKTISIKTGYPNTISMTCAVADLVIANELEFDEVFDLKSGKLIGRVNMDLVRKTIYNAPGKKYAIARFK